MKISWNNPLWIEQQIAIIITRQEVRGVNFDLTRAYEILAELERDMKELYDNIRPQLDKYIIKIGTKKDGKISPVSKPFLKSGDYSKSVVNHYGDRSNVVWGPFTRIEWEEPELTKRDKLCEQLLRHGWKPELFTPTGKPKLTEKGVPVDSLLRIEGGIGRELATYYTLSHRHGQLTGLINKVREDGRISAQADTCGANTTRFKHKIVVNIPKASPKIPYGKEMRSVFCASEDYYMLGCDASGLEARIMGHYTYPYDDGEFANELLHGDIHTKTGEHFGIDRELAKGVRYALTYGAQPPKMAKMLGVSLKKGKEFFNEFWAFNKGLGRLRERIIKLHNKNGWLPAIDGRKVYTRSEHSALNTLFQSGGSICVKFATVVADQWIKQSKIAMYLLIHMHDEMQYDIHNSLVYVDDGGILRSDYGDMIRRSFIYSGEFFKLRIPLDGDYKIGRNWSETH